jgi:uncharacterized protein (TIGR02588 family)
VENTNSGGPTAVDVRVPSLLDLAAGRKADAELSIAFRAHGSTRNAWVSFRNDPRRGTLTLGALAFEVP